MFSYWAIFSITQKKKKAGRTKGSSPEFLNDQTLKNIPEHTHIGFHIHDMSNRSSPLEWMLAESTSS